MKASVLYARWAVEAESKETGGEKKGRTDCKTWARYREFHTHSISCGKGEIPKSIATKMHQWALDGLEQGCGEQ